MRLYLKIHLILDGGLMVAISRCTGNAMSGQTKKIKTFRFGSIINTKEIKLNRRFEFGED
jgi:hypothetical protein